MVFFWQKENDLIGKVQDAGKATKTVNTWLNLNIDWLQKILKSHSV